MNRRFSASVLTAIVAFSVQPAVSASEPASGGPLRGSGSTWIALDVGSSTTCGIKPDHTAWCWGLNPGGDGDAPDGSSDVPVQVSGGGTWQSVDAGNGASCGVMTDGTAWCWGSNFYGALGDGTRQDSRVPVPVGGESRWVTVSAGATSCGIQVDASAWCWGWNGYGGLGNGGIGQDRVLPVHVAGGRRWTAIRTDYLRTCGIRANATAWCWGEGALGDGDWVGSPVPVRVLGGGRWTALSPGSAATCGVRMNTTAWCWGDDDLGELGNGGALSGHGLRSLVAGRAAWSEVEGGDQHSCAIRTDQTAWCWGWNSDGQIGDGSPVHHTVPVPVEVAGAERWSGISAGGVNSCGILTDGTAWCWGGNHDGQLGDGSRVDSNVPIQVS